MASAQVQGSGKEFWVGFMDNYRIPPNAEFPDGLMDKAVLEIVAVENANGKILFKGQEVGFNLNEGQNFTYFFPESAAIITREDGEVTDNGVQVLSDSNIMVYAYNQRERSTDATTILPLEELVDEYWVIDHNRFTMTPEATFDGVTEAASSFLVVALEDDTTVEITPRSRTFDGIAGLTPITVVLQSGQSYQIKARAQLTGSRVRVIQQEGECKKVAVFAGNRWGNNSGSGPDNSHMFVQVIGDRHVSSEFIQVNRQDVWSLDQVSFFTPDLEGNYSINGEMGLNQLGLGSLTYNMFSGPNYLEMTNAGFVMWKFTGLSALGGPNPVSGFGDPAMTYLMGLDQMISRSVFSVREIPTAEQHWIIIVVEESSIASTQLNGVSIADEFQTHRNIPGYAYARIALTPGQYVLENPDGFNAYQYGLGFHESYALTLFQSSRSPEFEVKSNYEFEVSGDKTACLLQEGTWEIEPEDSSFVYFNWDFGDQTDTKNGSEVNHTYAKPGVYEVEIEARRTTDPCEIPEFIRFEVEVIDNRGEITGPDRVCPQVDEFDYFFVPNGEIGKVTWEVDGGEIVEEYEDFGIKIRWGQTNENALVKGIAYTAEGCPSQEFLLPVTIRRQLEPGLPIGSDISCLNLEDAISYEVAEILPNRGYSWFVENGTIIGDNDSTSVFVTWSPMDSFGKIWYEEYSLNDEFCKGTSDQLEVNLVEELIVEVSEKLPVSCHGEATGSIELEVVGGSGKYTYEWDHDPSLNSPLAENLKAGFYAVSVLDETGCQGLIQNIEVTEPETLRVGEEIEVEDVSCFGKADGSVQIRLEGGVPPYSADYPTFEEQGEFLFLTGLSAGEHAIKIRDSNNCLVNATFEIGSPLPLEVEVITENKSCPGGTNGVLRAVPKGGVGPFSFYWNGIDQFGEIADGLSAGEYQVEVEDSHGCIGFGKINLVESEPILRMPTGFNPEKDLEFKGVSNCPVEFTLIIYNRWGELIHYETTGWDGTVGGQVAPNGTYTYRIIYSYTVDGVTRTENQMGSFVLSR